MAAASLGQVHRAALRDGRARRGQGAAAGHSRARSPRTSRPWRRSPPSSTSTPTSAAATAFASMLEEFRKTLLRELDYRRRRATWTLLAENLRDFDRIVVPLPIERLQHLARAHDGLRPRARRSPSSARSCALEIDGARPGRAALPRLPAADPGRRVLPRRSASRATCSSPTTTAIALLDLGMVARIPPRDAGEAAAAAPRRERGQGDEAATVAITHRRAQPQASTRGLPPRRGRPRGPAARTPPSARCRSGAWCSSWRACRASAASACRPS